MAKFGIADDLRQLGCSAGLDLKPLEILGSLILSVPIKVFAMTWPCPGIRQAAAANRSLCVA